MANNIYSIHIRSCACSITFYLSPEPIHPSLASTNDFLDRHPLCQICARPPLSQLRDLNSSDSIAIALHSEKIQCIWYVDTQALTVKTIPLCLHSPFPGAPTAAPLSGEAGASLHYALHCHGALCAGGHALGNHPGAQASLTQVHLEADLC